ncbi:MAG: hypothetical protein JWM36_2849 [Hyphomicrobiales bacterium]|nr:hypothetical protein [Hyphomicrobiales bacterium]
MNHAWQDEKGCCNKRGFHVFVRFPKIYITGFQPKGRAAADSALKLNAKPSLILDGLSWTFVAYFTEVESGSRDDRP